VKNRGASPLHKALSAADDSFTAGLHDACIWAGIFLRDRSQSGADGNSPPKRTDPLHLRRARDLVDSSISGSTGQQEGNGP
jgi:hypothetical protein